MKNTLRILWITFVVSLIIGITIVIISLIKPGCLINLWKLDKDFSSNYGSYIVGIISIIFSILSVFIILITLYKQRIESEKAQIENHFF